jgi:integrase-like protein
MVSLMKRPTPVRGIYEREKGSGIWWIRYTDSEGRKRREKVGSYSNAKTLLEKRHTSVMQGEKLPEFGRTKISFATLCDDAITHSKAENSEKHTYDLMTRIETLKDEFGTRPADSIRKDEIVAWFTEQADEREWSPATRNRWQACFSLIFRVAVENEKVSKNPAAMIRRKTENNEHVRFLSDDEETKLVAAIQRRFLPSIPGCG